MKLRFSERIKSLRKENNLTQEMLGEKIGLAQQSIASWESERSFPDTPTLVRLCTYFDVTADYLLGLSEDSSPRNGSAAAELIASGEAVELTEKQLKDRLPPDIRDIVMSLIKIEIEKAKKK